ncbi:transporter substrate-binding domain-containing protein [Segnochrobactrum spirostomi]|uniref:Transporter substrate-binding domain-containing protein n=1 Tax=Segnochrobactrum spirostomi TaxID=2608987 RepID=A0A6A7XZY8_9HYPH|nr:transporter substrate-binding domain-containing protein [Segnochrobactrum spirostomi]MQT11471.1 transporter substrate-binding domain-containing protein [Segnochrobactrum spirostomi]
MKTTLLRLFVGAVALVGVGAAAQAETIRFSVAAEPYPPFASKNAAGQWEGFEVDLIKALCDKLKPDTCELKETAWDGIIPALTSKKIDVIFASMSITDERKKTIDFSIPYYNTPAAVVAEKDSTITTDPKSFEGKTVGVQTATIHANFADQKLKGIAEIKIYNTQDEANSDLAAGRIDATIADSAALEPFLATEAGKGYAFKGFFDKADPIWGAGVGAGIRKGDTELLNKINKAIREIYADGTYEKIEKKYFTYDVATPPKS